MNIEGDKPSEDWGRYLEIVKDGYKKSILYNLSSKKGYKKSEKGFATGISGLDFATGYNGVPHGELIEIFGQDDTGKSSLALLFAVAVQRAGGYIAYIDIEGKFDYKFAKIIGVDVDRMSICDEKGAEEVFDICEILALGGAVDLVILDSLTALMPSSCYEFDEYLINNKNFILYDENSSESELNKSRLDCEYYQRSYDNTIIKRGIRRLKYIAKRTGCTFVIINQVRQRHDSVTAYLEKSTGGDFVLLQSGLRCQLFKKSNIIRDEKAVGVNLLARIVKGNLTCRNINIWLVLYYSTGFSYVETMILNAIELGILKRKSDSIYYKDVNLGNNRKEVSKYLEADSKFFEGIIDNIKLHYKS